MNQNRDGGGRYAPTQHQQASNDALDSAATGRVSYPVVPNPKLDLATEKRISEVALVSTPEALEPYLTDSDHFVRAEVASHPALSMDQAMSMSDDESFIVRFELARRWGDTNLIEKLAKDPDPKVRRQAATDPSISDEARNEILADPEVREVERAVANG